MVQRKADPRRWPRIPPAAYEPAGSVWAWLGAEGLLDLRVGEHPGGRERRERWPAEEVERMGAANVHALDLTHNRLLGGVPGEQLARLTSLRELVLHCCQLTALPPELGRLSALESLSVAGNRLSCLPAEIGRLSRLQRLHAGSNELAEIPATIGQLSALRELNLRNNRLAIIPEELFLGSRRLSALEVLDVSCNRLQTPEPNPDGYQREAIPPAFFGCRALRALYVGRNRLSYLPPEIGDLSSLVELDAGGNEIRALPREIGGLLALRSLLLNDNRLSFLPGEVGQLSALRVLDLDNNRLMELPDEVDSLLDLEELSLRGNELREIPAGLGKLWALRRLDLYENRPRLTLAHLPAAIRRSRPGIKIVL